ncbi:MAG: YihY/virulence factor BrkB family protein [Bacteroidales bacterium]|nr:YihY family inner membrane protein [Bacteroidales bacterium]MBS3774705.1 YihY family inner membrane protein [Bacteroidales bacterium]
MLEKINTFFNETLWGIRLNKITGRQRIWFRLLRTIALAIRGFREDKVGLRASALTVFTLLAVVPVVAMAFGIAKGFGLKEYLERQLLANFSGQEEVLDWIIQFANSFLEHTRGGLVAGIGLVILLWSILKVFSNIESSFNAIWHIHKSRSWLRKFSDYFSLILIAPILAIISSSSAVFISTQIEQIASEIDLLGFIAPVIFFLVRLIPFVLIWFLFTFLYMFMPNNKVNFRSALIGGIVAGTAFVIVQWLYIYFQIGVSRYNAIYGSFAALPLFIIWLQISWLIVLFGAEIAFSDQNMQQYEFESDVENISIYSKNILALLIMHLLVKNFMKAESPLNAEEISNQLKIPIRLVRKILYELVECKIVSESVSPNTKERAYQPGQDPDNLSIAYILEKLEHNGKDKILSIEGKAQEKIKSIVDEFRTTINNTEATTLLKKI